MNDSMVKLFWIHRGQKCKDLDLDILGVNLVVPDIFRIIFNTHIFKFSVYYKILNDIGGPLELSSWTNSGPRSRL
jgi:hypothetical protein